MTRSSALIILASLVTLPGLTGCVQRRIEITSEPSGAMVWLNDVELGRTPVETSFTFHGIYDVRLHLEGYEHVQASRVAHAPFYEWPGLDLIAEAAPIHLMNDRTWHFDLEPSITEGVDRETVERDLEARALELKAMLDEG